MSCTPFLFERQISVIPNPNKGNKKSAEMTVYGYRQNPRNHQKVCRSTHWSTFTRIVTEKKNESEYGFFLLPTYSDALIHNSFSISKTSLVIFDSTQRRSFINCSSLPDSSVRKISLIFVLRTKLSSASMSRLSVANPVRTASSASRTSLTQRSCFMRDCLL